MASCCCYEGCDAAHGGDAMAERLLTVHPRYGAKQMMAPLALSLDDGSVCSESLCGWRRCHSGGIAFLPGSSNVSGMGHGSATWLSTVGLSGATDVWGRRLGSRNSASVASLPSASGSAVRARLAAESAPRWTSAAACAARRSESPSAGFLHKEFKKPEAHVNSQPQSKQVGFSDLSAPKPGFEAFYP